MPTKKKYGAKGSWATNRRKFLSLVKLATNPELYIDAPPFDLPVSVMLRSSKPCFKLGDFLCPTRIIEHTKTVEYAEKMLTKYQPWLDAYLKRKAKKR